MPSTNRESGRLSNSSVGIENFGCCNCSLSTGCKFVAYFSLLISVMNLLTYMDMMALLEDKLDDCRVVINNGTIYGSNFNPDLCKPYAAWYLRATISLNILVHIFGILASVYLLRGIVKKKPEKFVLWMVFCTMKVFTAIIGLNTLSRHRDAYYSVLLTSMWIYFLFMVKFLERKMRYESLNLARDGILHSHHRIHMAHNVELGHNSRDLNKDVPPPYSAIDNTLPPPYSSVVLEESNQQQQQQSIEPNQNVNVTNTVDDNGSVSNPSSSGSPPPAYQTESTAAVMNNSDNAAEIPKNTNNTAASNQ